MVFAIFKNGSKLGAISLLDAHFYLFDNIYCYTYFN